MKNGRPGKIVAKLVLAERDSRSVLAGLAEDAQTSMAATGWSGGMAKVHDGDPYLQPVGAKSFVIAVAPGRWAVVDRERFITARNRAATAHRSVDINDVPGVEFFDSVRDANDSARERS